MSAEKLKKNPMKIVDEKEFAETNMKMQDRVKIDNKLGKLKNKDKQ